MTEYCMGVSSGVSKAKGVGFAYIFPLSKAFSFLSFLSAGQYRRVLNRHAEITETAERDGTTASRSRCGSKQKPMRQQAGADAAASRLLSDAFISIFT
ncbi:MAG: hypothetical protein K5945_10415 [Bacteroidaceae bacterium]|nr:hypothetical protein [Bacteroidaceae bacterium]